tara:strand:- start:1433 stop:1699 length:267 start_codon:yes stop_codon:yes gene_type:complete
MGQIKLESTTTLECTCEDGTKCETTLNEGRNISAEKIINISETKCDVVLSSGKTVHGLDKSLFTKIGSVAEETQQEQPPKTNPFYKFS